MKNPEGFYLKIDEIIDACRGIVKKDRSYTLPNGRKNFGFIYFLSGKATYTFANCVYTVGEGDMIFLKESSVPYRISSKKGTENLALNFTIHKEASFGDVIEELINDHLPVLISKKKVPKYRKLMENAINTVSKNNFGAHMTAMSVVYEITQDMLFDLMLKNIKSDDYNIILPAKRYIDDNFNKDISIVELANRCNMCETNFRKKFSSIFGISPSKYIYSVRINNAKNLFSSGAYSVEEVAKLCGFNDANYFSRFFKKHTGLTPMEYKNIS